MGVGLEGGRGASLTLPAATFPVCNLSLKGPRWSAMLGGAPQGGSSEGFFLRSSSGPSASWGLRGGASTGGQAAAVPKKGS